MQTHFVQFSSVHALIFTVVDTGSVYCRDYARTETSLACSHGAEEPTTNKIQYYQ